MNKRVSFWVAMALLGGLGTIAALHNPAASAGQPTTGPANVPTTQLALVEPFKTDREMASYALGLKMADDFFKPQFPDIDVDLLARGIRDTLSGNKALLSETQTRETLQTWQKKSMAAMEERRQAEGEKNKKVGEAFLAENKKKDGVKITDSGLQYKVIKEGDGAMPKDGDTVSVHYRGTLIDGKEFDSSARHGDKPATFPVNGVISGWTEALKLMKVGSKYQLFIPSKLAYGERGAGGDIGPHSTLVFDVELVAIEPSKTPPGGGLPPH